MDDVTRAKISKRDGAGNAALREALWAATKEHELATNKAEEWAREAALYADPETAEQRRLLKNAWVKQQEWSGRMRGAESDLEELKAMVRVAWE